MLRAIDFHGLKGVEFSKGEYTALLIPEMGANLVRLANTRLGAEILTAHLQSVCGGKRSVLGEIIHCQLRMRMFL